MTPSRIQRQRTKGWKMPPNTVSVTRPGPYGNPFRVGGYFMIGRGGAGGFMYLEAHKGEGNPRFTKVETAAQAVAMFRTYRERYPLKARDLAELRGKNLACWCKVGDPCHGDVLLELANAPPA